MVDGGNKGDDMPYLWNDKVSLHLHGAWGGEGGRSVDIIVNKARATPAASLRCAFASLTSHRDRCLAPGESPKHLILFPGTYPFPHAAT